MVASVSSSGLGLFNSSLQLLGAGGGVGNAGEGRSGARLFVNSATGNLVVQARDEVLAATGADLALVRTYNSQGLLNDDNADNWRLGVHQRVFQLTGTVNTAGSTVMKTFGDGADVLYTYDTGLGYYRSKAGDGAHDSLSWNTGTTQWTWTDGSLRNTETYDSTGRLINTKDGDGNTYTYTYTGNLLTQIVDASGQTTYLDYNAGTNNTLSQIRVVSNSVTQTITRYTYDGSNRLSQVRVDLTPGDNSIADNNVFLTTYTYDGTSKRIASIAQGSNSTPGSTVNFTYELVDGKHHLKTYVDGEGKITTFTYTASGATTLNANPAALSTTDNVPSNFPLSSGLLTTPTIGWQTPAALESTSTAAAQLVSARATSGTTLAAWVQGNTVFARVYNATTQLWGTASTLSGTTAAVTNLRLHVDAASGNAVVTWISAGNEVRVNRYVSGAWAGNESLGTITPTLSEVNGSINGNGQAAVVWLETSGSTRTVRIRRRTGSSWATAETVHSGAYAITLPQVAVRSDNLMQVVWRRAASGVERLYTAGHNGTSWSSTVEISVTGGTNQVGLFKVEKSGTSIHVGFTQANNVYYTTGGSATFAAPTLVTATAAAVTNLAFSGSNLTTSAVAYTAADNNVWVKRVGVATATVASGTSLADLNLYANASGDLIATWRSAGIVNATSYVAGAWATPSVIEEATPASPLYLFMDPTATSLEDDKALAVFAMNDGTAVSVFGMLYNENTLPYYTVGASDTWSTIGTTLYGSATVATSLATALGNPTLQTGLKLRGFPPTVAGTVPATVTAYYTVTAGQTWANITQAVYGSSLAAAATALQNFLGNPTLTTGLKLYVPPTLTYGGTGISTQTDIATPLGLQTRIVNDTSGRVTALLSPTVGGIRLETRYAYDADGNVTTITEDPTGANRVTTNTYDTSGNLTLTRDHIGNTVTRTYSSANQLVTETSYLVPDPDGGGAGTAGTPVTARYAYDSENHLRFLITAEGRVTEYRFNAAGTLAATIRYTGAKYDVSALTPTTTLSEAQLVTWIGSQDLTKIERTDYAYDFRGNITTGTAFAATDGAGAGLAAGASVTRYVYDQRGRLLSTIDPRGEATTGDPNDFATTYTYDGLGRMLTAVRWTPTGNVSTSVNAYNDATRVDTVTLANGLITTTTYDRVGRVLTVAASAGTGLGTTTYVYDVDGRLRMTTNPIGVRTHNVYDAAGRKIFTVDGDGTLTELIYDRLSNVVKTVEYAVAANTALVVDGGGVPIVTVDVAALRTSANGQPAQNRISRAVYDAAHRVVFTVDPAGNLTKFFYDGASRVTDTLRYATPVTISASIDELTLSGGGISGVTITTSADDRLSRTFYDNQGRTLGELDGAGYLVKYAYNGAGEVVQTIAYSGITLLSLRVTGTLAQLEASITPDANKDIVGWFFYDGQGRRIGALDGEKYLTQTVYDAAGNVAQSIRYPTPRTFTGTPTWAGILPPNTNGAQITSYAYNEQGRVTQETNFEGTVTEYKYDNVGNLTQSTRALATDARVSQARYDALGRVTAELTPEGTVAIAALGGSPTQPQIDAVWNQYSVKYAYDLAGRKISVTDQYGNVTLLFYDNDMRVRFTVRMVESAMGEVAELRYNALGQVTTKLAYANRISTASLAGGDVTSTLTTRVTAAADATKDSVTTYTYALTGHVATETTAEGGLVTNVYNAFGELKTSTQLVEGAVSLEHRYAYDLRGLLTQTRWDPNGINTIEGRVYDAFGRVTSVTDPRGNVRTTAYDKMGRTVQVTDPLLKNSYATYDAFSRVLTSTDRLGNVTQYAYNDTSRSVVVTTPENTQVTTVRNRHGQTATITDARGTVTTYEYDVNGQLKRVFDSLGNQSQQTYDRAGRAVDSTDANGVITRLTYDAASRAFTRAVDPSGLNLVTTYTYDGRGQNISTTDERGVLTLTAFNRDGQVKSVTVQMGASPAPSVDLTTTFTYDKRGKLRVTTEGSGSGNPSTMTYAYDVLGRRISETVVLGASQPDAVTQYKYDANGNLTRKIDARNYSTWYVYDQNDRLRWTIDALGGVTQSKYDDEGRVTETRSHSSTVATGSFGDVVTSFSNPSDLATDRVSQIVYDRDGRAVFAIAIVDTAEGVSRGIVTQHDYDGNGNIVHKRMYANTIASTVARTINGVSTALTPSATLDRESFSAYDIRNRATFDINAAGGVVRTQYDAAGNVVAQTAFAVLRATTSAPSDATMVTWAGANANAADRTTRHWYDAAHRQRYQLDAEGYVVETRYTDATRIEESFAYLNKPAGVTGSSTLAQVTSAVNAIVNANDRYSKTEYDKGGRATKITDAYGNYEQFTYDQAGNKLTYRNQKGSIWTYTYDANHRLLTETTDSVSITSVTSVGGVLTPSTASAGIVTKMTYDALGNVLTRTEAFGRPEARVTTYQYDQLGRQTRTIFPEVNYYNPAADSATLVGNAVQRFELTNSAPDTVVTYNVFGDAVLNKDVAGSYQHKAYDRLGRVIYEADALNQVTEHRYDVFGNETSLIRYAGAMNLATPAPALTQSNVWDAGQIAAHLPVQPTLDRTVTTQYDRLNRAIQVTQPSVHNFLPNAGSAAGGTTVTAGAATLFEYNAFGEVIRQRQLVGTASYADTYLYYDRRGLQTAAVDPLGYLTTMEYGDGSRQLTRQVEYASAIAWWNSSAYASPGAAPLTYAENAGDTVANGVTVVGDSAMKASGSNAWDSGFRSKVGYTGGATVSYTVAQNNKYLMVGLNTDPMADNSYASLDYALYTANDGVVYVYENGTYIGSYGAYAKGDAFSVSYDGSNIRYSRNGIAFRTVAASIAGPLYADSSFHDVGGRVDNIEFQQGYLADGVTFRAGTARKAAGSDGWNTAAFRSKQGYTGGATVAFTASQTDKYVMVGLNSDPAYDLNYASIDYAIYTAADGNVYVYESGSQIGNYGAYAAGDRFRVTYDGAKIQYLKNGTVFRELAATIATPLYADSSFYSVGGEVKDVEFGRTQTDREVIYAYDRLDRMTAETRKIDGDGGLTRDSVTTGFGYDAVGNRTVVTDALGGVTYTYYDVLGRVTAIAQPVRDVDGSATTTTLIPLTLMLRDVYGNLVQQVEYANGTASANATNYATPTSSGADRTTLMLLDKYGRVMRTTDPEGRNREASYTIRGEIAKEWQIVTNTNDSSVSAIVTIYQYDALGQQTAIVEPARLDSITQVATSTAAYNAFGEIISKAVTGTSRVEYFDYDQAGRVWRSNGGDGVYKVYLYDLLGNTTAEIRSQTVNLASVGSPSGALGLAGTDQMRTETRYDLLGRAVEQREVSFSIPPAQEAIAATFSFANLQVPSPSNAIYQQLSYYDPYQGTIVYYVANPAPYSQGGGYYQIAPPSPSNPQGTYGRVPESQYSLLTRGYVTWNVPAEQGLTKHFYVRTGGGAWQEMTITQISPSLLGVDVSGLPTASWEYQLTYTRTGDPAPYAMATGTIALTNNGTTTMTTASGSAVGGVSLVSTSVSGTNVTFRWNGVYDGGITPLLEVKPTSSGTWQTVTGSLVSGALQATVTGVPVGTAYDYRITHLRNGMTEAMGIGTMQVSASYSTTTGTAYANPGIPAVAPLTSYTYSSSPNTDIAFDWAWTGGSESFYYRPAGGSWVAVGSANGHNAWIGSLAPGNYEWQHGWEINNGYSSYGGSSGGTFVVNGTSSYMTTDYNYNDVGIGLYQNTAAPTVYTVIYWTIDAGIPGTPQFLYRPVGGSWASAPVYNNGAGSYYIVTPNLGGNYEFAVNYYVYDPGNPPYTPPTSTLTATATGTFWVSGTSTAVSSQAGSPGPLPGVYSSGTNLHWSRPANGDTVRVWINSTQYTPITSDNVNYYISFNGLPTSWYNYKISYTNAAGWEYIVGDGGINVTTTVTPAMANPSSPAGVSLISGFYDAGNRRLAWTTAANGGSSVSFKYRPVGGSWSTLSAFAYGGAYAVDLPIGVSGPYEYEVQYTNSGAYSPYAIGKGTANVVNNVSTSASVTDTTSTTLAPIAVTPRLQQKFDRWGNVVEAIDAALQATNNRYNQLGQAVEVTSPRTAVLSTVGGVVTDVSMRPTQRNYYDQLGRLVATRDGNGNINRSTLNAGGQSLEETHADGGVRTSVYDAFGQQIQVTDELGYRTRMAYDRTGNMTAQAREIVAGGFASGAPSVLTPVNGTSVLQSDYVYDGAGRRLSESSGDNMPGTSTPEVTRYWYDLRGNVIRRRSPGVHNGSGLYETSYEYDLLQNKTREVNANGDSLQWAYDGFGRVTSQIDMGGATTTLNYDAESKLLASQTNSLGQNISYTYDAAGHLTRIQENSAAGGGLAGVQRDTQYSYDAAGRRARERVAVDGLVHQDTHIAYDELGRMAQLSDLRYRTTYRYDGASNRARISSTYYDHAGVQRSDDLWYTYDAMNRVKVSQGVNSSGTVTINGAQGVDLGYDLKGQRTSAIQYGQKLALTQAWQYSDPYNPQQTFFYSFTSGASTELYSYDGLGRLLTTDRTLYTTYQPSPYSGYTYSDETMMRVDTRTYDKVGRELTSSSSTEIESNNLVTRSRTTNYDDSGRMLNQTTSKNGVKESFVIYGDSYFEEPGEYWYWDPFTGQPVSYTWGGSYTPGFDATGALRSYLVQVYNTNTPNPNDIAYTSTYFLSYRNGMTYQDTGTTVTSTTGGPLSGSTSRSYNVNGELIATADSRDPSRNRYFANDAMGQTITAVQGQFDGAGGHWTPLQAFQNALANMGGYNTTKSQHFFSALGQNVGSFGQLSEGGTFTANFDVNFTPVSSHYPASTPGEVIVQKGDTLRIVAARIWGDSNLWYLLAEENGVTSPDVQLEAGMALRVPNEVVSMRNDASSFKPFDVREVIGDTTPTQPAPPVPQLSKKKGCGVLGQILMIVVLVVVTIYTVGLGTPAVAGAMGAAGASAGFGATMAAGMGAIAGGTVGAGLMAGAAALGSIASQAVGVAIGAQEKFSWKSVALAAVGGAVTAGLGGSGFTSAVSKISGGSQLVATGLTAAAGNAITQGVSIALGLQAKFDWRSVAASALAAPLTASIGGRVAGFVGKHTGSSFAAQVAGRAAAGIAGQAVHKAFAGGRIDYAQVMADAFGNAIGNAIANELATPSLEARRQALAARIEEIRAAQAEVPIVGSEGERLRVIPASFNVNPGISDSELLQEVQGALRSGDLAKYADLVGSIGQSAIDRLFELAVEGKGYTMPSSIFGGRSQEILNFLEGIDAGGKAFFNPYGVTMSYSAAEILSAAELVAGALSSGYGAGVDLPEHRILYVKNPGADPGDIAAAVINEVGGYGDPAVYRDLLQRTQAIGPTNRLIDISYAYAQGDARALYEALNTRFSQSLTSTSELLAETAEFNQSIGNYEGADAAYSSLGFAQMIQGYANQISFARDALAPAALRNESRKSLFIDAAMLVVPGGAGLAARGVRTLRAARTLARLNRFESEVQMASSLAWTQRSARLRSYIRDIETQTGMRIQGQQRRLLAEDLRVNNYTRLSRESAATHRREFNRVRENLIREWEQNTGQVWPTYADDVRNARGQVIRKAGENYDAHHIIESSYGGPNRWWNLHPARYPGQHQGGIHRSGSPLRSIFE